MMSTLGRILVYLVLFMIANNIQIKFAVKPIRLTYAHATKVGVGQGSVYQVKSEEPVKPSVEVEKNNLNEDESFTPTIVESESDQMTIRLPNSLGHPILHTCESISQLTRDDFTCAASFKLQADQESKTIVMNPSHKEDVLLAAVFDTSVARYTSGSEMLVAQVDMGPLKRGRLVYKAAIAHYDSAKKGYSFWKSYWHPDKSKGYIERLCQKDRSTLTRSFQLINDSQTPIDVTITCSVI